MTALPARPKTRTPTAIKRWLAKVTLESGAHFSPEQGGCLMEAIAYIQDQPFSDHPACVSSVVGAFGRSWNDSLDDAGRQRLKRFIPDMIGTATTRADETTRAWLATDWLVRSFTPTWLDKAGLNEHAAKLRDLEALSSTALAKKAQPIIEDARKASAAAWDAAWAAAGDAAWAAARAAARDAAWAAAWDAARAAAGDAARDAAWAAAWDAAWAAAGDAARAAARDAARAAAAKKKSYNAQYDAAYQAAKPILQAALADTITELRASAEDLLLRMCAVGREDARAKERAIERALEGMEL
jgi:hypothetical protein